MVLQISSYEVQTTLELLIAHIFTDLDSFDGIHTLNIFNLSFIPDDAQFTFNLVLDIIHFENFLFDFVSILRNEFSEFTLFEQALDINSLTFLTLIQLP